MTSIPYMVEQRAPRRAVVIDRSTGRAITGEVTLQDARALVRELNNEEHRLDDPLLESVRQLSKTGYSHGSIANQLGISRSRAEKLLRLSRLAAQVVPNTESEAE